MLIGEGVVVPQQEFLSDGGSCILLWAAKAKKL
jgi:hypothetical protein